MGKKSVCEPHHNTILAMTRQGHGRHTIAQTLGVSHAALSAYMRRRGIRSGQKRGAHRIRIDRDTLRHLIETDRLTYEQAAKRLSCHPESVGRAARKMGLRTARTGPRAGAGHPQWGSGRVVGKYGYIEIYAPLHPFCRIPTGRVLEHRLIMEVVLGRYLEPTEVIDHRDNHPRHNWPQNLRRYTSNADHLRATLTGREKQTPRSSIPGAYGSNQKTDRCPRPRETLALCPSDTFRLLRQHIEIHRPTTEHAHLSRSQFLRSGPVRPAFEYKSKDLGSD